MSLRWKSELVATLGPQRCDLSVRTGLWGPQSAVRTSGTGNAPVAIAAALQGLRAQIQGGLPKTANLSVSDETVYYALLPATAPWSQRHAIATQHFAELLGRQDLHVRISLIDSGRTWLAAAIEESDRLAWTRPFADAGITLRSIRPALVRDLQRIAAQIPHDGVLAIVRHEGVMLLSIAAGALVQLQWERCAPAEFEQRVEAFARSASADGSVVPVIVFTDELIASDTVHRIAAGHRWQELRALAVPSPVEVLP